jgi:hypothetical protein
MTQPFAQALLPAERAARDGLCAHAQEAPHRGSAPFCPSRVKHRTVYQNVSRSQTTRLTHTAGSRAHGTTPV